MEHKKQRKIREWDEWYEDAKAYYDEHGDLLIPRYYRTDEGFLLGRWIERQRAKYNGVDSVKGTLNGTEKELLEKIGMVWKIEYRFPRDEWIKRCLIYKDTYGNLLVPKDYKDGKYHLGNWIGEQRRRYYQKELSEDEVSELTALGMVWTFGHHRSWMEAYEDAKGYYESNGNLLIPHDYVTKEGFALGVWMESQRVRYKGIYPEKSPLSKAQRKLLEDIGIVWDLKEVRDDAWMRMYEWIRVYRKEKGKLPVWPVGIRAPDGRRCDGWIRTQRGALMKNKLPKEKVKLLNDIGIRAQEKRKKETGL